MAPLLPLSFLVGYQFDLAYGSKVNRIRAEADNIVMYEPDLLVMPGGLPTVRTLDAGRAEQRATEKFKGISVSSPPST